MPKHEPKIPYIDPDNVMHPDRVNDALASNAKPVIEIRKGEVQPLAIYSADMEFMSVPVNVMMSIILNVKSNAIEMRGRLRFDWSGKKTTFGSREPKDYTPENYKKMLDSITNFNAFAETQPTKINKTGLIEFNADDDMDTLIAKMNRSNMFDIGITSDKEKVDEYVKRNNIKR